MLHAQIDRVPETALFDEWFWNPDTARIADANQFDFQRGSSSYIVITAIVCCRLGLPNTSYTR